MNLVGLQDTNLIHRNLFHSHTLTKKTISFTIITKTIRCLGINLPKKAIALDAENYKILMKELKDDPNRWKDILYSWIGRINIV